MGEPMAKQQVFSEQEVDFGTSQKKLFWNWTGDNSKVPHGHTLDVTTATFNYFPTAGGSVGRADLSGRDSTGTAVWRLQIVYVEPKKTVHFTFPKGLVLGAGGHVEVGFTSDGPGTIFVSVNGTLD
jgi:hypothetical protein